MRRACWRLRTLLGLVVVAALGVKGVLVVRSRYDGGSGGVFGIAQIVGLHPRPAYVEPTLLAALNDPDPGVRHTAAWALDRIGSTSPALVQVLIARLETESEHSRWMNRWDSWQLHPAESLKRIKLPASAIAPRLRKAMASRDRWVRLQATEILCDAAGRPGPTVPALASLLLAALRDGEAKVRTRAAEGLARLDADTRRRAVAVLLEGLRGSDRLAQSFAVIGLAGFDPEAEPAVTILADRLRDGDLTTRLQALSLLGRLGPIARPAVPAIVREMTSADAGKNEPFFPKWFSLGQGAWHATELGRLLDSGEWGQSPRSPCTLGAAVLGRIGPGAEREAVAILLGMLPVGDEPQRLRVVDALGALGPKAAEAFPDLLAVAEQRPADPGGYDRGAVFQILTALTKTCAGDDPRLVAALVRLLASDDRCKRSGASSILDQIKPPPPEAVPGLIGALKDESQAVRFSSARALGRYDGPEGEAAVPALIDATRDKDGWVRTQVAKSLARHGVGASEAVPAVAGLLRNENPNLRWGAAESLGAFGPAAVAAVAALREARDDPEEIVRDAAEKALRAIERPETADPVD